MCACGERKACGLACALKKNGAQRHRIRIGGAGRRAVGVPTCLSWRARTTPRKDGPLQRTRSFALGQKAAAKVRYRCAEGMLTLCDFLLAVLDDF